MIQAFLKVGKGLSFLAKERRTMLTGFRPSFVPAKKFFEELQNRYVALWFELHLLYEATLHPPPF